MRLSCQTKMNRRNGAICALVVLGGSAVAAASPLGVALSSHLAAAQIELLARPSGDESARALAAVPCIDGSADIYPCDRVDLMAFMPLGTIGGGDGNDVWGWTDPLDGKEYAIMGRSNGTAFVDVSDPVNPVYLGNLPSHTGSSSWRDIKVYQDHAFVVSDLNGSHGLQVFDLDALRDVVNPPVTFSESAHYGQFGSAHNIAINEDSGFAYVVGGNCSGGLHMIDLAVPDSPQFAGCFSSDGYTHDTQCVDYLGPDPDHQGKEICFNSNEDTLTIVDTTIKTSPVQLSRTLYSGRGYTHQGWLTDDHAYFLLDDELDESNFGHNTRTYVWDVRDLDAPTVIGTYTGDLPAIDHNQYVHNGYTYQANYRSGLRILSLDDVANGNLTEVAYFDIYPASDSAGFSGAWSVYPYFDSGNVLVSGIDEGLFVLRPQLCTAPDAPTGLAAAAGGDNVIDLGWSASGGPGLTFNVYRSFGACPGGSFEQVATGVAGLGYSDDTVSGQVEYSYLVTAVDATGFCESAVSNCSSATTTGECNAPPIFAGLESAVNPATTGCALDLGWSPAAPNCGSAATYSVYRDTTPGFDPSPANRLVSGLSDLGYHDTSVESGQLYAYVVRATDETNGVEEANRVEHTAVPTGPITDGTWTAGAEVGDPAMLFTSGDAPEHLGWEMSSARQHSGERSYFSTYANGLCVAIQTPPIELTAGEASAMSFWTLFDIEPQWDGGVVELSTDGGGTWSLLPLSPPYPSTFNNGSDACGYPAGHPSFSGTDLDWSQYSADLGAANGGEVLVRWVFSTDSSVIEEGWYVDDIAVTHAQVPGECSTAFLFADGFESGDTSAWSAVVP